MKFMLDTNAYNQLLDNEISVDDLNGEFFTTHIQEDELNNTKKEERRRLLNAKFKEIHLKELPTESGVWNISKWNKFKWSSSNGSKNVYHNLLESLEKAKPKDRGNIRDALIGETAIKNEFILVTNDVALQNAVKETYPYAQVPIDFAEFIEVMKNEKRN